MPYNIVKQHQRRAGHDVDNPIDLQLKLTKNQTKMHQQQQEQSTPGERSSRLLAEKNEYVSFCSEPPSFWQSFRFSWQKKCCYINKDEFLHAPASSSGDTTTPQRSSWTVILLGQSIALALSCANAASSTLENDYQIKVPTYQTGIVYFILSFHLVFLFLRHRIRQRKIKEEGYEMIEEIPGEEHHEQFINDSIQQLSIEDGEDSSSTSTNTIDCIQQQQQQPLHTFPFTTLPIHTPWYIYLLLSILDVEANYLAMLSFQHTSLSSSMLLTSLSVLSTVLLRQLIFRNANYGKKRSIGIVLCLLGGCLWLLEEFYHGGGDVVADIAKLSLSSEESSIILDTSPIQHEQPKITSDLGMLYGDFLALSAACLYGLNDVMAEYFVKTNNDTAEYLGMLGFFGSIISFGIQVPLLEKESVQKLLSDIFCAVNSNAVDGCDETTSSSMMIPMLLLLCFTILLCYFYMSVMNFLSKYDSTILNLSLQSCPLWAVVLTMLQKSLMSSDQSEDGDWIVPPPLTFFVSLTMVFVGMFLYESNHSERSEKGTNDSGDGSNVVQAELERYDNNIEVT